jgi:glycosyltransferase involved in cell wall biosynthesis
MLMKECILFVHSSDEMYGADKILMELVVNIKEQYHPIVIVPSDIKATYLSDALRSKGVNVRKIPLGILRRKYFTFIGILKFFLNTLYSLAILISIINKNDVRIIHSNTLAVFSGALAASICRKPHVWHVHENILYPKIFWKFTSLISQLLSDKVICVSNPTKEHLLKGISIHTKKVSVIHNGISEKELQQCSSSRESTRRE